jgi:hypothetical protein
MDGFTVSSVSDEHVLITSSSFYYKKIARLPGYLLPFQHIDYSNNYSRL